MKSVNNHCKYGIAALLLIITSFAYGAGNTVKHFIGLSAEAGEWSLLPRESNLSASMGGAGAVGFVYDLQAGHFLFDLGLGVTAGQTVFSVPTWSHTFADQTDTEGDMFDYVCQLSHRRDAYTNVALQIPLMFGGQYKRFYAMAGVKFSFNAFTQADMTADLSTYGKYFQYLNGKKEYMFDRFFDQPPYNDLFFANRPLQSSNTTTFNVNLDASIEIGARLGFMTDHTGFDVPKSKVQYRLALFADYGVLDLHQAQNNNAADILSSDLTNAQSAIQMHDILSTSNAASAINNLLVGIKFTVLFQMPTRGNCIICRDAYTKFRSRK